MADLGLVSYIKENLEKGVDLEDISQCLVSAGWPMQLVESSIDVAINGKSELPEFKPQPKLEKFDETPTEHSEITKDAGEDQEQDTEKDDEPILFLPKKPSHLHRNLLILIIGVIILAAGGAYLYLQKPWVKKTETTSTPAPTPAVTNNVVKLTPELDKKVCDDLSPGSSQIRCYEMLAVYERNGTICDSISYSVKKDNCKLFLSSTEFQFREYTTSATAASNRDIYEKCYSACTAKNKKFLNPTYSHSSEGGNFQISSCVCADNETYDKLVNE